MPGAAALILTTIAVDILASSAVIGITFFVILRRFGVQLRPIALVLMLLAVFAFLDLVWWPAAIASSVTLTIEDRDLAAFFSIAPDTPISSLLGLGLIDLLTWFIQAGVALWVAYKLDLLGVEAASNT